MTVNSSVKMSSSSIHSSTKSQIKSTVEISKYIDVANNLADAASKITLKYFRTKFDVEIKSDCSPVTIADRETEIAMRELLAVDCPGHSVFGEEHGIQFGSGEGSQFTWVLDPIDGTKSFITGKPLFGTLIALLHNGRPILGVIDQPYTRERWIGADGYPSTLNGQSISTRACSSLSHAYLYATTPHMFEGANETAFNRLRDSVRIPMYGCDCYAYGLLASGMCDLVAEADLKPYDYMALVPIIKGAGGVITDWEGKDLVWNPKRPTPGLSAKETAAELKAGWPGEVLAAGNAELHAKALAKLAFKL
eukprot:CAMPEP_0175058146 /NCGR_PEP_ID=MMETSP0052_2-20121109/11678_1 /TAXON_ID=51329 ORGANISM="Polytomella parva, Strain SAG 63-3" /NCGR_SAMPLE_ID=MMETSP0052_2 /ASSEMBLY_ACC=CAM_ASM_000194 /LENGTH=306 /DNA_ID=CAMNT_0016323479 /DNA_START=117 /DNA_END=1037 /DNA_ORIENTATION=+